MIRVVAAPHVLLGARPLSPHGGERESGIRDGAVVLDGDRVLAVGPRAEIEAAHGPAEPVDAVILPALVNAHLHLELSHLAGRVPGGEGLAPWILKLVAARGRGREASADRAFGEAVEALQAAGVAAVGEVTNTLASLAALGWAGFSGTIYHEVFGFSAERADAALTEARSLRELAATGPNTLTVALSPHSVYSTHPGTLAWLLRSGPASIHLAEDPGERAFCATGTGPFAEIARMLGAADADLAPRGRSAVAAVAPFLGPRSLVVHAVDLDDEDLGELARCGATVVLCPRSNVHIGRRLPDLPRLLASGIPLAIGSDSLASTPSLSPLAELAALRRGFREVAPARLLALAWNGDAVGARGVGKLAPGTSPGVLAAPLGGERPDDPAAWLLDAVGAEERPLTWLARNRPEVRA